MTTITNFLHSNFISSTTTQNELPELPIWILNGNRNNKIQYFRNYVIENCVNMGKCIVHIDLGIDSLRLWKNVTDKVQLANGLQLGIVKGKQGKQGKYYLIPILSQLRNQVPNCLNILIAQLNALPITLSKLSQNVKLPPISLFIEGLQLMGSSPNQHKNLQSFINQLSGLNKVYKQITILKYQDCLSLEHQFALQRISTCLTNIVGYVNGQWTVKSTVRRYSGYSNQEKYTIKLVKNKMKVEKWAPKEVQQTETEKQLLTDLNFVVKKGNTGNQQNKIKQMIYPHLQIIQNATGGTGSCKSGKRQCGTCDCDKTDADEGLIILDDEQEDDDDVDV